MKKINLLKIAALLSLVTLTVLLAASCNSLFGFFGEESSETESQAEQCKSHKASDWIIDVNPTCSAEGSMHTECTVCGATLESVAIEILAHTEEIVDGKAPTCSATGLTQGKRCATCGAVIVAQSEIAAIPHTEKIVGGKNATCTEDGLTEGKKCSVCDAVIVAQSTIPALGHTEGDWITDYSATAQNAGQRHKECTLCRTTLATEAITAVGADHVHTGSSWNVTKPATCAEEGVKSFVCECGETLETQAIQKTDKHTEVTVLGRSATCTEQGLTDGKKCSVCGIFTVKQTPTATVYHTEETVLGKAPTCTEAGTTDGKKCAVCGTVTVTQIPIAPKGHSFKSGLCTCCGLKESFGIWITDGFGMPLTNIIVNIEKDGKAVKMFQYKGEYAALDLEDGSYTVKLDLSGLDDEYIYEADACVLTPDQKSLNIKLYRTAYGEEPLYVSSPIDANYDAFTVRSTGSYKVSLTPNDYTFFIFAPQTPAIYTMTYECENTLGISYHGGTFFVQGTDLSATAEEFQKYGNGLAFSVYSSNIGATYVFAIKSEGDSECVLNIQNVGDPGTRLVEEPWTPYLEDADMIEQMKNYPREGTYTTIDLGDTSLSAVLNPDDGYYHLNSADGPVIFIDFTTDSKYVASIFSICSNQRIGTYIYDSNGNVVEKRSYNELFLQCGMPNPLEVSSAEAGIRAPLTEKLAEAIISFGNNQGWWKENPGTNIFTSSFAGLPFNQEYAWLLYCGYYK